MDLTTVMTTKQETKFYPYLSGGTEVSRFRMTRVPHTLCMEGNLES